MDKDEKRLLIARFVYFHLDQLVGPSSWTKMRKELLIARFVYYHLDQVVGPLRWKLERIIFCEVRNFNIINLRIGKIFSFV